MCCKQSSKQPDYDGSIVASWRGQLAMNVCVLQMPLHCLAFCTHTHMHTPPGVMSVFFNHLHCRTSTMAQVPTSVAKSLFNNMQLSLSNMKTSSFESCCNYLKQHSPPYAPKGAKITRPVMVGYGLVVEKKKVRTASFQSLLLIHGPSWTIIMVHCDHGECIELALDMVAYLHCFLCCS